MVPLVRPSQRTPPFTGMRAVAFLFSLVCFFVVFASPAAAAGPHSARLSADLDDHLSAGSQSIRVIVHGSRAEVDVLAARYNLRIGRYLQSGAVFVVNAGQLEAMRQDDTQDHLSGDVRIQSSADVTAATIGADQVWAGSNGVPPLTGTGIAVAVIDSGIDTRHAALKGRVLVTRDFTGGNGQDRYGHGTHVAAIIAGQQGTLAETREYRGIASGAYLLNLRVLGDDGSGMVSDVIEAIDWAIEHRHEYNTRIINLSLGGPVLQPYRDDPLCEAVERAVRAGLVVVVAAGNYGQTVDGKSVYGAIASPANSPHAIAVGAIDTHQTPERSDDTLAPFSSKGPTRYDLILKPDVAAPGTHVVSAEATDSYLSRTYATRHVAGSGINAYMQLSGTSMSAGVVSGASALVLDARESLTPSDTRAALQLTSTFLPPAGLLGAGAGLINVVAAVELVETNQLPTTTTIAGEDVVASGLFTQAVTSRRIIALTLNGSSMRSKQALWGTEILRFTSGDTILWGISSKTILWGTASGATILWGTASGATILWGTASGTTILWGTASGATILWGTASGTTILWGTASGTTILWGTASGDTILWGTAYTF